MDARILLPLDPKHWTCCGVTGFELQNYSPRVGSFAKGFQVARMYSGFLGGLEVQNLERDQMFSRSGFRVEGS